MLPALVLALASAAVFPNGRETPPPFITNPRPSLSPTAPTFQMLTVGEPDIPETVTFTRASETFCPGGENGTTAGEWLADDVACTNDFGLKIDGARTNVLTHSDTDTVQWTGGGLLRTPDTATAPDGATEADKWLVEATSAEHRFFIGSVPSTSGTVYTCSIYVATSGVQYLGLQYYDGASRGVCTFDLNAGSVHSCTATLGGVGRIVSNTSVGGKTFRRVSITATSGNTTASGGFLIVKTGDTAAVTQGTGSWVGDGVDFVESWGAQCEAGAFASPLIRTTGTAATRQAEVASISTPGAMGDAEGCASASIYVPKVTAASRVYGFGATNRIDLGSTTTSRLLDGTNTTTATALSSIEGRQVALKFVWSETSANGTLDGETDVGTYDESLLDSDIYFGSDGTGNHLFGYIENVKLGSSAIRCD